MRANTVNHIPSVDLWDLVRSSFLKEQMERAGLNPHAIAVEVAKIRERKTGKAYDPKALRNTIVGAIENPEASKLGTIEEIVQALNGRLTVSWTVKEVVEQERVIEEDLTE